MVAGLFQALLLVTACSPFEAYNKTCPHSSQRTFRSHDVCSDAPINYSCLFDTNNQNFIEYCNIKPDFAAPGEYYVITGSRRNIECKRTTYQPYSLWSNESRSCAFEKSKCTQSGQVMYRIGSPIEDSQCRCDNTKQYAFVSTPENRCFCIPSKEDCSCFIKQCGFGYILNADYKCKPQSQRNAEKCEAIGNQTTQLVFNRTTVEKKTQIGNSSYPTSFTKLEKVIPMQFVLGLPIILGLSCLAIGYNCEKIGRAVYSHKSDRAKTTNLKDFGDFKVVATIDIGSTFSWYGSSTTEQFKTNPLNISVGQTWWNINSMYLPTKTATCILLGQDGKFKSLGHEAHSQYVELLLDGEADGCLFFDKFKMDLYNNENISDCMLIKDVKGREMKLIDVFSSFISKFMKQVKNSYEKLKPDEIQWVVTVPAVCSDKAKDFIRHCVEKNGVRGNRLIIALESEVVSVYFHYLNELLPKEIPKLNRRFVVVDIGGCFVDITAHEKKGNGDLRELCSSTGFTIGGKEVDENFLALFREIFGNLVMNALSTEYLYLDSYFDILKEIENFKRNFPSSDRKNIFFYIPSSNLNSLCEKYNGKSLKNTIASSKYSKEISLKGDRMIFLRSSLLTLFQPVGERISNKIRQVTEGLKDVGMMLLAGGFSMSPEIVNIIKQSFGSMEIIEIPPKYPADLAVMNGAVLYGHRPQLISSRITKYTYGRLVQPIFKKDRHDPSKLITINGIDLCNDVFETLVNKNTRVKVNKTIQKEYKGMHHSQKCIKIFVYTTKKDKVDYVDDSECKLFCEIEVPLSGSSSKHPCIIVDFIFGYSEFRVTAFDKETKVQNEVSVKFK